MVREKGKGRFSGCSGRATRACRISLLWGVAVSKGRAVGLQGPSPFSPRTSFIACSGRLGWYDLRPVPFMWDNSHLSFYTRRVARLMRSQSFSSLKSHSLFGHHGSPPLEEQLLVLGPGKGASDHFTGLLVGFMQPAFPRELPCRALWAVKAPSPSSSRSQAHIQGCQVLGPRVSILWGLLPSCPTVPSALPV